jgi:glutamate--cysteine ligase
MSEPDGTAPLRHVDDVHGFIKRVCFKTGPPGAVGIESEWFVVDPADPDRPVPVEELQQALTGRGLPHHSLVTFEPGGQLELSTTVAPDLSSACRHLAADLSVATEAVSAAGLRLLGEGTDPRRRPHLQLLGPRYAAMHAYFGQDGSPGEAMMGSTAAVQLSLDAGADEADVARRWHLAHGLLPVLLAMFANSPHRSGRPTGFRSSRFAIWSAIDPTRTAVPSGPDPIEAWARYVLAARVMLVRSGSERWITDPGCSFAEWVSGNAGLPTPTEADLAYHLTTLFPPVRPRGWFELRWLDALPDGLWPVAVAVTAALIEDRTVGDAAAEVAESVHGLTPVAMRDAVADRRLHLAAERCLDLAVDALPRMGAADLVPAVDGFRDRYTARGRCPADDLLDHRTTDRSSAGHPSGQAARALDPSPAN